MSSLPIPHLMVNSIYDITPTTLTDMGISLLLLDLDNTMAPYHIQSPSTELRAWIARLKECGIEPFIVSNNHGKRPELFAQALGIGYIAGAGKPSRRSLRQVMAEKGVEPEHTAIMGDQIYTDVFCGRRAGIFTIAVTPLAMFRNPVIALRYFLEFPFRLLYKIRRKNGQYIKNTD